ncbi:MAG: phosphoribosylformylglycinamidine cyclo-ligase [Dehalococcoidales bacterium]
MAESYKKAGVDIDNASRTNELIAGHVRSTMRPEVLGGFGFFGGLFELGDYRRPVLVSSVDGVGTKLKVASAIGRHDTVGIDIVNHCVNDILAGGAAPLFFLDYIAMGKLVPERVEAVVRGLARACSDVGCALVGGETAEMPGIYTGDDYELAGFIVGVVEKDSIINGEKIQAGDSIIGLPSSGLHTNGYSLVRRVFGDNRNVLEVYYPELGKTLGEELLTPHRCYFNQLKSLLPVVKAMAHITGGGLMDNVPRVLPEGLMAVFDTCSWSVPPVFELIRERGGIDRAEMYRVFNMGIGMAVFCSAEDRAKVIRAVPDAVIIGEVEKQRGERQVIIG